MAMLHASRALLANRYHVKRRATPVGETRCDASLVIGLKPGCDAACRSPAVMRECRPGKHQKFRLQQRKIRQESRCIRRKEDIQEDKLQMR